MNEKSHIELIAGSTMQDLGSRVYSRLTGVISVPCSYTPLEEVTFANAEYKPKITETIRQKNVYYIHAMQLPDPNTGLVSLALTADAISRASPNSLTLVLPYMSYMRQDRKDEPRVPISAKVVANILQLTPKLERIITLDMHCDQLQGFYEIPVDNLYGSVLHSAYLKQQLASVGKDISDVAVISPDVGGTTRARRFAQSLGPSVPMYCFDKRRSGPNKVEELRYIGEDIRNKTVILYDDMIDTGGSVIKAAQKLRELGAHSVSIYATHGLFSEKDGTAEAKFADAQIPVVVTESIPRTEEYKGANKAWLTMLPLDELIASAIKETATIGGSVSKLFVSKAI